MMSRHEYMTWRSTCLASAVFLMLEMVLMVWTAEGIDLKTWAEDLVKKHGSPPIEILEPREVVVEHSIFLENVKRAFRRLTGTLRTIEVSRVKSCFANQRVILGAIEMYNLDRPTTRKTSLSDKDVSDSNGVLVSGGYLKTSVTRPRPECRYAAYGDPSEEGIVYCLHHGAADEERTQALRTAVGYTRRARTTGVSRDLILAALALVLVISVGTWFFVSRRAHVRQE